MAASTYLRDYKRRLREAVVAFLGSKCARCGYNADIRALQVDHIKNNGSVERRKWCAHRIYKRVLNGEPGYQLLCANCNWLKRYE